MRLDGKLAVVTGGAQGIGAACAAAFAAHGASVMIADVRERQARAVSERLARQHGVTVEATVCDVASDDACDALVAETLERHGRIDVLVNNAAILSRGSILDLPREDFDRVLGVNLRPAFVLSQTVARHMVEQQVRGSIINMSSVNAVLAIPEQLAYVVAKGGLAQLTRAMALALAPHDIRVNAIGPGSIETEILQSVMEDDAARERILSRTPLGRTGTPEEIAQIAVFLASDYASYVTGQTIYADGGRLPLNYTVPVPSR